MANSAIELRPFRLADLQTYRDRAIETGARQWFSAPGLDHLEADPFARTAEIDGLPVASGGLSDHGDGVAFAWAVLTELPRKHLLAVHRAFRAGIEQSPFTRIETHVEAMFDRSHRWVQLMGFRMDTERPTTAAQGMLFVRYHLSRAS